MSTRVDAARVALGNPKERRPAKKTHGPTFRVKWSSLIFETRTTRICVDCRGRVDISVGDSHMCPSAGYWWGEKP